jgi:ribonuclease D
LNKLPLVREILAILSNEAIKKIGADVRNDIAALNKLRHFTPRGFVDLQNEMPKYGIEDKSLRKMSGIVLGKRVSKAQRLSNWEAKQFTPQQQLYAATDAWVCIEIYKHLRSIK